MSNNRKKVVYPLSFNPVLAYYEQIESGEVTVGWKVRRIYKKLVDDIHDQNSVYEYSAKHANHAIEFVENFCKHSKGKWAGQPVDLELWQKAYVAATFGFIHKVDQIRKYREVLLVVARKNGKSTLSAAICLYLMVADGEGGAEVYAVATKEKQAKIVWSEAKRMVRKSPSLWKRIKTLVKELIADFNDSSFMPLGSDSDTLDGLNVHGASLDEIHAWKHISLYDVIVDGTSAREQPLINMITTAGTIREALYDLKYDEAEMLLNGLDDPNGYEDETFLPIIYELDERKEWTNPDAWQKANPALGTIKKVDSLSIKVNKAKSNPSLVSNLLTKDFNMRATSADAWLTFEQLNNQATFDVTELKPSYAIGGADLSQTTDLTAACALFMLPGDLTLYVMHMYWIPEDVFDTRMAEDRVPYDKWYDQGFIRKTPGNKVHYKHVTEWFVELRDEFGIYFPWVGYDRWSADYWVEEMKGFFGSESMMPIAQGKQTLSQPMQNMGADLEKDLINYGNNPVTKWCLSNTSADTDRNGEIQPIKVKKGRRRIDGMACMLNAYVVLEDMQQDYQNMI
ncbi:terminase large subunit [Alkalicoccobacillus gibsonii]|uniref:terminase large subunit n=1 Tax=Alkalicoccobacillus gibsonii TaxID=79881 RepID=UPI003F7C46C6